PATIPVGTVTVNGTAASALLTTPASRLILVVSPESVSGGASITVDFASTDFLQKIANPSSSGSNTTLRARIGEGSTPIGSGKYTIASLTSETLTTATVSPSPNTANTAASYTLSFDTGVNGALGVGDSIVVVFPSGTTVPGAIGASSISVNNTGCTAAPAVSSGDRRVAVITPVAVNASSSVNLSFTLDAGIMNPGTAGTEYRLDDLHTNIQPTPNGTKSSTYTIIQPSDVTAANITPSPSTAGLTAQVSLSFVMGTTGLSSGDTITVTFPSGTSVPSSISSGNVTVTDDDTSVAVSGVTTTPASRIVQITVGEGVAGSSSMAVTFVSAAGIKNPTTPGNGYTLTVAATGNGSSESNVYEIT
ncbi:MAG: hypothetical protein KAJ81_06555, partial [Candidatus Latescibacteria bacterium]|nr:hypothetical protein [Candidatus Latescibacterota bacterium]